MAKKKEEVETVEAAGSQNIATAFFKETKKRTLNHIETPKYKVPFSSLIMTAETEGGISPGFHRFIGRTTGGKTHCAFDVMMNFLALRKNRRGVYFKVECRCSDKVELRIGVKLVYDPAEWTDGTCLVVENNCAEDILGFVRRLIGENENETQFCFVFDSLDNMIRLEDMDKPMDKALQVAGGALILSSFFKFVGNQIVKGGHLSIFISQVRSPIKSKYDQPQQRQGEASGGHAVEHMADWVFEFQSRTNQKEDYFYEKDANGNTVKVGHWCYVNIVKSDNEKYDVETKYPICYGRTGGKSVWVEREIYDLADKWNLIECSSWIKFSDDMIKEFEEAKITVEPKFHGKEAFNAYLENNKEVTAYLFNKMVNRLRGVTRSELQVA